MTLGMLCVGLGLFLAQPGRSSRVVSPASAKETSSPQKNASRGDSSAKSLFARRCSSCHGAAGRGETLAGKVSGAPDMTDGKWQAGVSEKRMATSIRNGRGTMPSFDGKLSQDEIAALVSHVRKFKD
jgi:cbb3-type cytochrome c oxidase subunit III